MASRKKLTPAQIRTQAARGARRSLNRIGAETPNAPVADGPEHGPEIDPTAPAAAPVETPVETLAAPKTGTVAGSLPESYKNDGPWPRPCPRGTHALTGRDSVYIVPSSQNHQCVECRREIRRAYRQARKSVARDANWSEIQTWVDQKNNEKAAA